MIIKEYVENLYQATGLLSSFERRKGLVIEMQNLENQTIHCFTCPGTCCTSQANSMQITPIEALEILASLNIDTLSKEEINDLKKRMQDNIQSYRLNVEIYTGKKHSQDLRKTYTCPFFMNGSKGCGISRGSKPYGCLGFNPRVSDDNGKSCTSNISLLSERDDHFLEKENLANQKIRDELKIYWGKLTIPQALLDILNKLYA